MLVATIGDGLNCGIAIGAFASLDLRQKAHKFVQQLISCRRHSDRIGLSLKAHGSRQSNTVTVLLVADAPCGHADDLPAFNSASELFCCWFSCRRGWRQKQPQAVQFRKTI